MYVRQRLKAKLQTSLIFTSLHAPNCCSLKNNFSRWVFPHLDPTKKPNWGPQIRFCFALWGSSVRRQWPPPLPPPPSPGQTPRCPAGGELAQDAAVPVLQLSEPEENANPQLLLAWRAAQPPACHRAVHLLHPNTNPNFSGCSWLHSLQYSHLT